MMTKEDHLCLIQDFKQPKTPIENQDKFNGLKIILSILSKKLPKSKGVLNKFHLPKYHQGILAKKIRIQKSLKILKLLIIY